MAVMKNLLFLIVLMSSQVFGHDNKDWILLKEGNTIQCDTTSVTEQSLYYKIGNEGTNILALSKVSKYHRSGEDVEMVWKAKPEIKSENKVRVRKSGQNTMRIGGLTTVLGFAFLASAVKNGTRGDENSSDARLFRF